ncbi:MAG: hypothetical protein OXP11_08560 [Gammaproteobacteria bacterium]|nr:hypothetical protein [Gammaproteobacteria bacterium]MDE0271242.1 hypothetical protein [Gammaproteobacteria bacterium]
MSLNGGRVQNFVSGWHTAPQPASAQRTAGIAVLGLDDARPPLVREAIPCHPVADVRGQPIEFGKPASEHDYVGTAAARFTP